MNISSDVLRLSDSVGVNNMLSASESWACCSVIVTKSLFISTVSVPTNTVSNPNSGDAKRRALKNAISSVIDSYSSVIRLSIKW